MADNAMFQFPVGTFELISNGGSPFTIPVKGQKLILHTKDPDLLPYHNEYAGDSNRCTIAETPWGGMKGSYVPCFTVGTVSVNSGEGVFLTDVDGNNNTTVLSAGKLKELGYLTVNTTDKTITEEFIINTPVSSSSTPVDNCTSTDGWAFNNCSGTITATDHLIASGTAGGAGGFTVVKTFSITDNTAPFICFAVKNSQATNMQITVHSNDSDSVVFSGSRFTVQADILTHFVLPLRAPANTVGQYPTTRSTGFDPTSISKITIGATGLLAHPQNTLEIYPISLDEGKWSAIEMAVPDSLASTSAIFYVYTGSDYEWWTNTSLDTMVNIEASDSSKLILLDGSKIDDIYGSGQGRAVFPKGISGDTITGSLGAITYSQNKGTSSRIGVKFLLPPSDNDRTDFNKIRLKIIIRYDQTGDASYEFDKSTSDSFGLMNMEKPWLSLLDSTGNVGYLVFTERPNSISYVRDDSGNISEIRIDPGNAMVYGGSTYLGDQVTDTNADGIPDVLDEVVEGSIANVLKFNGFNEVSS